MKMVKGSNLKTGNIKNIPSGSKTNPAINTAKGVASKNVNKNDVPNAISKPRKKASLISRFRNGNKNKKETNSETNSETSGENKNDKENASSNVEDNLQGKSAIPTKIKIYLIIGAVCFIIFIILFLVISISLLLNGGQLPMIIDVDSYANNSEIAKGMSADEKKYYKKISDVVTKYEKDCEIDINKNYINSILQYPYYSMENKKDFDYNNMTNKVDTVVQLMVKNCKIDYKKNGTSYNNLKNSSFFNSYYDDILKKYSSTEIMDSVFDYAEEASIDNSDVKSKLYIMDNLKVNVINSKALSKSMGIKEYIAGNVNANVSDIKNSEVLKANAVISSTNILASANYVSNTSIINVNNNNTGVLYCNISTGCSKVITTNGYYLQDGGSNDPSGGSIYQNGKYYYRLPLNDSEQSILNNAVDSSFGVVLLDSNKSLQIVETKNITSGNNYKQMLSINYDNYNVSDISEDNYTDDVSYGAGYMKLNVVFYDQNNYSNVRFCGRNNATIKSSGCGTTAMAIVASTLISSSYTPQVVMNDAQNVHQCGYGIDGTNPGFFRLEALKLNLKYSYVNKSGNLNKVTNALSSGKSLVIAHMGPGTFTKGGHYIVLGGIDASSKRVYVYDPNHSSNAINRKSGNGWYSFNDVIVKQVKRFYIFTKG